MPNSRSLSIATTGGVRQVVGRVDLELDPLLEVDQVELDLVGAVVQGDVDDQGMEQRRLARAGPTGDEDVLRRPLAQGEVLPLGRARLAEREVDPGPAVELPPGVRARGDELEGDLDPLGVPGRGPAFLDQAGGDLAGGRGVEDQGMAAEIGVGPVQPMRRPRRGWSRSPGSHRRGEAERERAVEVAGDQGENAARDAARGDPERAGRRTSRRSRSGSRRRPAPGRARRPRRRRRCIRRSRRIRPGDISG